MRRHGPLTDLSGVREVAYQLRLEECEPAARFEAGMGSEVAALDLAGASCRGRCAGWRGAERIGVDVDNAWGKWSGTDQPADTLALFGRMARHYFDARQGQTAAILHNCRLSGPADLG